MVRQIPFTKYEAALLLDAYLKVLSGDLSRMDSVKKCSQLLRAMAVNSGIEIDDIYRNVNGISFQMASMESAYQGKTIMKPATQLFTEIVQLFRENNKEYHDLLNKAKDMANAKRDGEATIRQAHGLCTTNPAKHQMILDEAHRITETLSISVEDAFFAYAKDKTGIPSQMLVDYLQKAADYCHLKQPLLGMTDAKAVHNAQKKVAEGKLLRFRFGKNAQAIRNVTQLYYAFIKSYHDSKEDVITRTTRSMKDAVMEQAVSGAGEQTTEENVPTLSVEEISTLGEMVKTVESTTETPSEPIDDPLLVDFTQDGTYSFTKPVSYTYKDKVYPARSWNQIYVEICGLLFTDYRDAFMGIMNEDIPGYNALAFADERNYRRMQVPKSFAPGYYLESNLDATAIVRKMRGLHQLIRLGDKLRISYRRSEDKGGEISEEATSKEWIIVQLKARGLTYQDKRSWGGCLWIVGDHRLDAFVQECREKGYKLSYKADGCKTYPNCPVWWTKNHVEEEVDTSDFRRRLDESFRPFLLSGRNLARSTATQYSRSIEAVERFMLERRLNCTLDTNDPDEVQRVYDVLMGWEDFIDWNNQYHHQYSAALAQYVGYLRQDETDTKDTDSFNAMTIKDVAIKVLHDAGEPLTMSEIMRQIDAGQLYKFNSSNPTLIVYQGIRRYCKGMKAPNHAPVDVFDRFTDETGQIRYMLIGESLNATGNTEPQETASADDRWLPILQNSFPDGYILNDFLGQFQAAAFWQERYRDECPLQGDAIDAAMKAIGIVRDGRVFTKSDEDKQLISTICAEINDILAHYTAVYRSCIYDRYHEQLAACSIYTEQVMAQQLLSEAKSAFYLGNQVFVKRGQSASVIHDARKVLRNHGGPMSVSNIAKVLWFIPHDVIYHCLSADDESINIGSSTWMLAEHFPLTREGAGKIGDMLDEYFLTVNYVQASDLMPLLENRLPGIADDLNGMNNMAIFNIVAYYLRDRFSFTKAIIAPKGSSIDFNNLFKSFAAEHDTFTLADLETLAYELKLSMIYWESIYAGGAVRISKTDFVNARLIDFDVDAIDAVLQDFCPGDYLPLMAVSSAMMMHLPSVGYQWNGYLLQSYVFGFSKVFGLSYSSFGKTGYYGAMVRRSCKTINNSFAIEPRRAVASARGTIAACIGARPEEIYFTSGGTEADNWALMGSAFWNPDQRGHIITSSIEHHAILHTCDFLKCLGYDVDFLPVNQHGLISAETLDNYLRSETMLVSIMLANNEIGTIEPIKELAEVAHQHGCLFHTDAVQAVGHILLDVKDLGVDMLSASAHKFNGPKGIGFLYIRDGVPIEPLLHGGAQENNRRAGTENVAGIVGMATALQEHIENLGQEAAYLQKLADLLLKALRNTDLDFIVNGGDNRIPGSLSLSFRGAEGEMLLHRLDLMGTAVATGSACDSKNTVLSHVIRAIGVPDMYANGTIRITFGMDNTFEQIPVLAEQISCILKNG